MKQALRITVTTALLAAAGVAGGAFASARQPAAATAFVGVHVVPMDSERILRDQTVIVREGRIAAVGPVGSTAVPDGAQRIESRGRYLMPGLADMHGHLPPFEGTEGDAADIHMRLYLANGVTTVRGMQGHPAHIQLRERVARGDLTGPTIVAGSPPIHGKNAADAAAAAALVAEHKKAGFDLLKVWEGLSPDAYTGLMDAARSAGLPVAGHVTATVGLDRALAARQASIEHLDGYLQALVRKDSPVPPPGSQVVLGPVLQHIDESRMKELAARTREAGVYNTPTLELFKIVVSEETPEPFLAWPEMRYISPALRAQFAKQKAGTAGIPAPSDERKRYVDLRNKMTKALADAGAGLLIGPDSPQMFLVPGFATHREIRAFVAAGLSPYQALLAATRSPAQHLRQSEQFGTVAAGRRADLLLLDADPLADIGNLEKRAGLMLRGRWFEPAQLQKMLDGVAALYEVAGK